jgi:hypothetical protein
LLFYREKNFHWTNITNFNADTNLCLRDLNLEKRRLAAKQMLLGTELYSDIKSGHDTLLLCAAIRQGWQLFVAVS